MGAVIGLLSPRSFARTLALLVIAFFAANCSPDAVRFNDNPFAPNANPLPTETTGSAPRGQIETRPSAELQPGGQPLPAVSSRAPPMRPPKRGSKITPGRIEERQQQSAPSALPAQAARKPSTWLPAPPEGMRSVPPDFLMGAEK